MKIQVTHSHDKELVTGHPLGEFSVKLTACSSEDLFMMRQLFKGGNLFASCARTAALMLKNGVGDKRDIEDYFNTFCKLSNMVADIPLGTMRKGDEFELKKNAQPISDEERKEMIADFERVKGGEILDLNVRFQRACIAADERGTLPCGNEDSSDDSEEDVEDLYKKACDEIDSGPGSNEEKEKKKGALKGLMVLSRLMKSRS